MSGWQLGIDIGGTFTDVVASHPGTGETRTGKVPSLEQIGEVAKLQVQVLEKLE